MHIFLFSFWFVVSKVIVFFVQSKVSQTVTEYSDFSFLGIEDLGNSLFLRVFLFYVNRIVLFFIITSFKKIWLVIVWFLTRKFVGVDAYLAHLKEELDAAEAESAKISNEIELLNRTCMEGKKFMIFIFWNTFITSLKY